jgi:hypothetical protein
MKRFIMCWYIRSSRYSTTVLYCTSNSQSLHAIPSRCQVLPYFSWKELVSCWTCEWWKEPFNQNQSVFQAAPQYLHNCRREGAGVGGLLYKKTLPPFHFCWGLHCCSLTQLFSCSFTHLCQCSNALMLLYTAFPEHCLLPCTAVPLHCCSCALLSLCTVVALLHCCSTALLLLCTVAPMHCCSYALPLHSTVPLYCTPFLLSCTAASLPFYTLALLLPLQHCLPAMFPTLLLVSVDASQHCFNGHLLWSKAMLHCVVLASPSTTFQHCPSIKKRSRKICTDPFLITAERYFVPSEGTLECVTLLGNTKRGQCGNNKWWRKCSHKKFQLKI